MIRLGVRALLVYEESRVIGLSTSHDIQGERPIQVLQSSNHRLHHDIRVADVMTPWAALRVLEWEPFSPCGPAIFLTSWRRRT